MCSFVKLFEALEFRFEVGVAKLFAHLNIYICPDWIKASRLIAQADKAVLWIVQCVWGCSFNLSMLGPSLTQYSTALLGILDKPINWLAEPDEELPRLQRIFLTSRNVRPFEKHPHPRVAFTVAPFSNWAVQLINLCKCTTISQAVKYLGACNK